MPRTLRARYASNSPRQICLELSAPDMPRTLRARYASNSPRQICLELSAPDMPRTLRARYASNSPRQICLELSAPDMPRTLRGVRAVHDRLARTRPSSSAVAVGEPGGDPAGCAPASAGGASDAASGPNLRDIRPDPERRHQRRHRRHRPARTRQPVDPRPPDACQSRNRSPRTRAEHAVRTAGVEPPGPEATAESAGATPGRGPNPPPSGELVQPLPHTRTMHPDPPREPHSDRAYPTHLPPRGVGLRPAHRRAVGVLVHRVRRAAFLLNPSVREDVRRTRNEQPVTASKRAFRPRARRPRGASWTYVESVAARAWSRCHLRADGTRAVAGRPGGSGV